MASAVQGWMFGRLNPVLRVVALAGALGMIMGGWMSDLIGLAVAGLVFVIQKGLLTPKNTARGSGLIAEPGGGNGGDSTGSRPSSGCACRTTFLALGRAPRPCRARRRGPWSALRSAPPRAVRGPGCSS
jgi:hypothetical protein